MNIYLFLLGPISFFWFVGLPGILLVLTEATLEKSYYER